MPTVYQCNCCGKQEYEKNSVTHGGLVCFTMPLSYYERTGRQIFLCNDCYEQYKKDRAEQEKYLVFKYAVGYRDDNDKMADAMDKSCIKRIKKLREKD